MYADPIGWEDVFLANRSPGKPPALHRYSPVDEAPGIRGIGFPFGGLSPNLRAWQTRKWWRKSAPGFWQKG